MVLRSRVAEKRRRRIDESDRHSNARRLIQRKRDLSLGVNTALQGRQIGRSIRAAGKYLLVFGQGLIGLIGFSQPDQHLAQVVVSRQIVWCRRIFELNYFSKLLL